MSTKTTLKRLALVAVSAMGFGLLSAVPSSAATISSLTVGTLPAVRVNETATVAVTVNMTANATSSDTVTVSAKAVAAPTQGGLANVASQFAATTSDTNASGAVGKQRLWFSPTSAGTLGTQNFTAVTTSTSAADGANYMGVFVPGVTAAGAIAAGGTASGVPVASTTEDTGTLLTKTVYLSFRPDVAGTYTFLVSADDATGTGTGANFSYVAGDISTSFSITVGAVAPAKVVLTRIGGTPSPTGSLGSLIKVSLQDAAGLPATITGDEAVTITTSSGTITKATVSSGSFATGTHVAGTTSVSLVPANLINGVGFVNVKAAAEAVATITATGDGSLSPAVTNAISATFGKAATATGNTFVGAGGTAVTTGWYLASGVAATGTWNVPTTATSSTLEFTHAAIATTGTAIAGALTVIDTSGKISSSGGAGANTIGYDQAYTRAASGLTYTTVSISHAAMATGSYSVSDSASGVTSATVTGATAAFTNGTLTATPSTVRMATGGSVAVKAILKNQYGVALANTSVTVTVAGRNSAKASQTLVTDATGYITYSFTDTGTTGTSDVITLNGGNAASTTTVSVVYSSVAVKTVDVVGGATEDIAPTVTRTAISTGNIGNTTTGAVAFTATVADADGNPLAGVPVTFSVDKGLITKTATVDYTTVYTDAAGEATTYAFNWLIEKQTVTATAGGVSGTGYANWAAETASTARVLSATVSGNTVTFKAVDRFGNPVNGVVVTLSRTGSGYFGTGASTATATTDRTGTVQVQFTGAGTITGELATTSQGWAIAGSATSLATGAYKVAVAGETTGTGVSFAPAGVGSVTVTVDANSDSATTAASAAADAAAEATDAANAATDAANAAAEAADAATAAAQDAADAVAALSAQVATLISGLKSQLTALTNLVIKIQKKVKA